MSFPNAKHAEVTGLVSMRPGHNAGATCTCGWHSHHKTFLQHIDEVEEEGE